MLIEWLRGPQRYLQPLQLLCTGTAVAILGQLVNNQAKISADAQLLVLSRYVFTFFTSLIAYLQEKPSTSVSRATAGRVSSQHNRLIARSPAVPDRTTGLLVIMGFLDLASYAIFNLGFAACGSALATVVLAASGQIITAVISVTALHRRLSVQHLIAIAVVTVGLTVRSLDDLQLPAALGNIYQASSGSAGSAGHVSGAGQSGYAVLFGAACIVVSALLFSILGCLYEVLMKDDDKGHCPLRVSQAQATYIITGVSLCGTCLYQLLYTLPHWHQLVVTPVTASPHSGRNILASHVAYGLVTAVHNYVQVKVLGSHGAMAVGLVNALRASVVSYASSWLFCAEVAQLCITYWKAVSALVVTCGAALWVLAGKPSAQHSSLSAKPHSE